MKAKPVKNIEGRYVEVPIEEATHVTIHFPGPVGKLTLPVIRKGTREGTGCWSWNGSVDKPTLKPSVLTAGQCPAFKCHTWITDGRAQFLDDTTHELRGQTVDLVDVE